MVFMVDIRPVVRTSKRKIREGRGFSSLEIKEAGVSIEYIRKMKIPFDKRRKSCRKENVNMLKEFLEKKEIIQ